MKQTLQILTRGLLGIGTFLLFIHCTAQTTVILDKNGSGTASLRIDLHPILMRYYSDLAAGFIPTFDPKNPKVFDLESLYQRLAKEPNLTLQRARNPVPERLEAEFSFQDIRTLLSSQGHEIENAITLEQTGQQETVRIRINQDTIDALLSLTPESQSALYRMLLPSPGKRLTEAEYKKQLAWALEEYAGDDNLPRVLEDASIHLVLKTPGPILHIAGGTQAGLREARFTIPLLRIFTTPLEYAVTYQRESL
ncbi:MAG TPA: hypothetical protein PLG79_01565 [Spirochaetales bacterium]|nr:hypothetical protein [Spirochaetales bacterium]